MKKETFHIENIGFIDTIWQKIFSFEKDYPFRFNGYPN
jgi:hypothetical protein